MTHCHGLTLALRSRSPAGCDLEAVTPRPAATWLALLGAEGFRLAQLLAREEPLDQAATRVWSTQESLKKCGNATPPVLDRRLNDGTVLLRAGHHAIATLMTEVQGVTTPLVFGVAVLGEAPAPTAAGTPPRPGDRVKSFDYPLTVSFEDTNVVGNVYFANYIRWQGRVREQFLADKAPTVLQELKTGLELVTLRVDCRYFAQLFPLDRVRIRMTLQDLSASSARMNFEYFRITEGPEQLVARGSQEFAASRLVHGQRSGVPLPEPLRLALAEFQ